MSPILVAIALVFHLFPFRTEKLSPTAPMVLRKRESRSPPSFPKVRVPSPVIRGRDAFWACSGRDGRSSFPVYCPFSAHSGEGRFFAQGRVGQGSFSKSASLLRSSGGGTLFCAGEGRPSLFFIVRVPSPLVRGRDAFLRRGGIPNGSLQPSVVLWSAQFLRWLAPGFIRTASSRSAIRRRL